MADVAAARLVADGSRYAGGFVRAAYRAEAKEEKLRLKPNFDPAPKNKYVSQ
jgi:hypothetical protein